MKHHINIITTLSSYSENSDHIVLLKRYTAKLDERREKKVGSINPSCFSLMMKCCKEKKLNEGNFKYLIKTV